MMYEPVLYYFIRTMYRKFCFLWSIVLKGSNFLPWWDLGELVSSVKMLCNIPLNFLFNLLLYTLSFSFVYIID